jgi:hypothetical protein
MPKFLTQLSEAIENRREDMARKLNDNLDAQLETEYRFELEKYWNPIPPSVDFPNLKICAVDGSMQVRELANGTHLYVTRALGITNFEAEFLDVQMNILESRGIKEEEFSNFVKYKMEYSEMQVIKQFLDNVPDIDEENTWVCFLDGSWYAHLLHRIWEVKMDEEQDVLIEFFDILGSIFKIARKKNVWLLGVSKGSTLHVLKDVILQNAGPNILATAGLDTNDEQQFLGIFADRKSIELDRARQTMQYFDGIKGKYANSLDLVQNILIERLYSRRSDTSLISRCAQSPGYSTPMKIGPTEANEQHYFQQLFPPKTEATVKKQFKQYLSTFPSGNKAFIKKAVKVIKEMLRFSSIISFNLLPALNDLPLRIDFPIWMSGLDDSFQNLAEPEIITDANLLAFVQNIVKLFMNFYGGTKIYHVFLKRVDEKVKLTNQTMNEIYEKFLEKQLNHKLIHTRDYRRVVGI